MERSKTGSSCKRGKIECCVLVMYNAPFSILQLKDVNEPCAEWLIFGFSPIVVLYECHCHILTNHGTDNSGLNNQFHDSNNDIGFATETWFHIAVTYDSSNGTSKFYLNGIDIGGEDLANISPFNSTSNFTLGQNNAGYDGLLDEVGIWNRVLSDYEIKVLYALGHAGFAFPEE